MNRDALFGIVGGVLLVGAMVATFYYEAAYYEDRNRTSTWPVTWATETASEAPKTASIGDTGVRTLTFSIQRKNLTQVEFVVTWPANQAGQRDSLSATVTGPGPDQRAAGGGASGSITMVVSGLNPMPGALNVTAPDNETARRELAASHTQTNGTGDWTVTVQDPNPSPATTLQPFTVTVTPKLTYYVPKL